MIGNNNSSPHRLVGKFFTNSNPPSFDETEQSLRKQWILSGDMTVRKLEDDDRDKFLFEFRQEKDKKEVLRKGPFYVNGVLIVIKDPDSSDGIIDFTFVRFVVAVVGFPRYLYNKISISNLKSLMGENCPACPKENDGGVALYVREVDLKKPLNPGFYIAENRFVQFKYKNLGDFCYNCGMIGHKRSGDKFTFPKERDLNATSRTHVYGPWLRFSPEKMKTCHEMVLKKSVPANQNCVRECEKTLSFAQFFIEIEFNKAYVCNPRKKSRVTKSTHKFVRFVGVT